MRPARFIITALILFGAATSALAGAQIQTVTLVKKEAHGIKIATPGPQGTTGQQGAPGVAGDYNDLINKPAIPAAQVNSDWNAVSGLAQILNKPTLFSGAYTDLTGKPALFSGAYADLTGKPILFSGVYGDLTGKPAIPAAQVNSDWNAVSGLAQILNKPTLFSGAYTDLTGKPALFSGAYADLTGKPILFSGVYDDLTGKPAIPAAQVNSDWNAVSGLAQILNKPTLFSGAYTDLTGKPALFSGAYADLTGKPTLGGAAALNVGTTAGTVAAGDDSRMTNARTPTTHDNTYHSATYITASSAVAPNGAITGATKTKISYDTKGLVTAGADATTADIADSTDKRYVTDAQRTVIGNTSGTNSGDNAANSSTMYIGTTAHALNRASASEALTGISSIDGSAAKLATARNIGTVAFDGTANIVIGHGVFTAFCTGAVTSSQTIYYGFAGYGSSTTACTGVAAAAGGMRMTTAGTVKNLYVNMSAAGKANDAITLYKNGSATGAPTCVYGTGTTCADTSTLLTVAAGDIITIAYKSGTSDGSANISVSFELWN